MTSSPTLILNNLQIRQKIERIAYQIYEDNVNEKEIIFAGIANSGYVFAEMLLERFRTFSKIEAQIIEIKLNKEQPTQFTITPELEIEHFKNKVIILVDDVLNSGKTLMYGLRPFLEADVKKIRTALLVDRDHKRYPIEADFVGLTLSTTLQEHISVEFSNNEYAVFLK